MLYQERNGLTSFNRDRFRQCISLQYRKEDEQSNGKQFLERLSFQLLEKTKDIIDNCGFDFNKESAYYATLGMKKRMPICMSEDIVCIILWCLWVQNYARIRLSILSKTFLNPFWLLKSMTKYPK